MIPQWGNSFCSALHKQTAPLCEIYTTGVLMWLCIYCRFAPSPQSRHHISSLYIVSNSLYQNTNKTEEETSAIAPPFPNSDSLWGFYSCSCCFFFSNVLTVCICMWLHRCCQCWCPFLWWRGCAALIASWRNVGKLRWRDRITISRGPIKVLHPLMLQTHHRCPGSNQIVFFIKCLNWVSWVPIVVL